MGGKNTEGYADPTASEAIGRVSREEKQGLRDMCNNCRHHGYCSAAFRKDVWCGNYTQAGGKKS